MSRIHTPSTAELAPANSQPLLDDVKQQLGSVPNLFRILANSPVALEGYLGLNTALSNSSLSVEIREGIALAIAQFNGCEYCLAAHTYLAKHIAKLTDDEISANRLGSSLSSKKKLAIEFAHSIAQKRGKVEEHEIRTLQIGGYSDAEILEVITTVVINIFSNYANEALKTDVDFPAVDSEVAA